MSRHRASFREFSLAGEAHTEVLTRWRSPEWICLRSWQAARGAGWGCAAGGHPGALPSADGDGGRRPDRCGAARAHGRADGLSEWEPDPDVGHADGDDRA